ncbi:hypothetical protein CDAR_594691 [Caerostris darwini]|uniref:Uncharacterized protein n=1 Tax=Caerostris darwini TaxID=1538125 RepID=A0AAV4WV74_9ARAC|nr:hypothetical protein CDAR_594691 [Caerostris darwini]
MESIFDEILFVPCGDFIALSSLIRAAVAGQYLRFFSKILSSYLKPDRRTEKNRKQLQRLQASQRDDHKPK